MCRMVLVNNVNRPQYTKYLPVWGRGIGMDTKNIYQAELR